MQVLKEAVKPVIYATIGAGFALLGKYGLEKGYAWYQKRQAERKAGQKGS